VIGTGAEILMVSIDTAWGSRCKCNPGYSGVVCTSKACSLIMYANNLPFPGIFNQHVLYIDTLL
jgi:hypothetical protein